MTLPRDGMPIFPTQLWDGLTTERLSHEDFRGAGPATTAKIIDEILGIQNYLSKKSVTLPPLNVLQGNGTTYESIVCYIQGNCVQLQIHNASFPEDPQGFQFAWNIDLSQYLPIKDNINMVGFCLDNTGGTFLQASLSYYPDQQLLVYINPVGTNLVEPRDLFNNFYLI